MTTLIDKRREEGGGDSGHDVPFPSFANNYCNNQIKFKILVLFNGIRNLLENNFFNIKSYNIQSSIDTIYKGSENQ